MDIPVESEYPRKIHRLRRQILMFENIAKN